MSSEVKQCVVEIDGKRMPFQTDYEMDCSDGCIHDVGPCTCAIANKLELVNMECCTKTNFFQPREAEKPLAEQVKGWLEAREYVVWGHAPQLSPQLAIGLDSPDIFIDLQDGFSEPLKPTLSYQFGCNTATILHHGDAVSTITWLKNAGYEVEIGDDDGNKSIAGEQCDMRTITKITSGIECKPITGGVTWVSLITLGEVWKITRFYRPAPAETDAQKIERLSREGFTVEYATENGVLHITSVVDGQDKIWSTEEQVYHYYPLSDKWSESCTYLAHYREPEPDEVLAAAKKLQWEDLMDWFASPDNSRLVIACSEERSQQAYDLARWQLIESNPENNVSL